ncbi:Cyclin-J18 [Hirschfeldia incana]|nr:Cyclin-J18 [Hirschfeldia incana]
MSTEIAHLRRRLLEFLIQCHSQLELPLIVKYSALSLFFDRFRPCVVRFLQKKKKSEHWLLQPLTESNLQLFVLISIWISCKIHCSRGLSVQSLKSLGDKMITEQLFTVRDFVEAELVFLKVMKFEIGTLNIAYTLLDDLLIQFKEVAKVGELLNFEACMDMMDLLYEKEETSVLYHSSTSLAAASILVSSYIVTVPKQQWEFPILPWVKMVTNKEEREVVELVGYILSQVLYSHPS